MKKQYNTLIIGLGKIGLTYDLNSKSKNKLTHISSILNSKYFSLYGIVDVDNKKRKICKDKFKTKTFSKLNEIKKKKIDLIIISTPTNTHFKTIKEVLLNFDTKVILIEKPATKSYTQIKKIYELAQEKKINVFVNYSRITDLSSKILKKCLKNEVFFRSEVFYSKSILNNASHFINLFQFFFGKVLKCTVISIKKKSFKIKFKNLETTFIKKNIQKTNNFLLESKRLYLDYRKTSNQIFLINRKKKKKINSYNMNLNYYVIKNLEKFIKKKNFRLCTLKEALETHKVLSIIKKKLQIKNETKNF